MKSPPVFRWFAAVLPALCAGAAAAASAVTLPEVPVSGTTASALGLAIATIVGVAMKLRKTNSRDAVERGADDYLRDALGHAKDERDNYRKERDELVNELREAWSTKTDNAREIGRLTAQVESLQELLRVNNERMAQIQRGVQFVGQHVDKVKANQDSALADLVKSGPSPLGKIQ